MHKHISPRISRIAMALLLFLSLSLIYSPTASAQSSCAASPSAASCDGRDPQSSGCGSNAYTIVTKKIYDVLYREIGIVELRYSPTCQTNWTRTTSWVGATTLFSNIRRINHTAQGNPPYEYQSSANNATQIWSPMVWSPTELAGGYGNVVYGWTGGQTWTGWY